MKEWINGMLFINGYATDGQGRPRTISNGYSSEDEQEAREQYLEAINNQNTNEQAEYYENLAKAYEKDNNLNSFSTENVKQTDTKNKKNVEKNNQTTNKISKKSIINQTIYCGEAIDNHGRPLYYVINNEKWPIEYMQGKKYIGGYATNDAGVPICTETGYSGEDVAASIKKYEFAKSMENYNPYIYY